MFDIYEYQCTMALYYWYIVFTNHTSITRLEVACSCGILSRKVGPQDTSLGGADAEGSGRGVSLWGGFNFMVLKKLVT